MTTTVLICACPSCSCEAGGPPAVQRSGQSFCSDACANGHPNHEPCHDGAGACGCTCGG
ncbi:conjugal transfer protein TrbI [Synechococcus sp. UW179A]|uniref:conjugal transfer protein TrbI n=1 Tax=Synechococcus sp. UW179A TaxID=2575510 RepID=UPI000E0E7340|nr:conjugal transfer protein TrbI [Synechococcus sp. UW179A]